MKVGDWVKEVNGERIGVITQKNNDQFFVKFRWNHNFATSAGGWIHKYELKYAPMDVRKDDIRAMINLALDTKDYRWFIELQQLSKAVAK